MEYFALRAGTLRLTEAHRDLLSNDLGAVVCFLFDLGAGRYAPPPRDGDVDPEVEESVSPSAAIL